MGLAVNVLCRNLNDDRVIPRFSRYLRDCLGWTLTARPDPAAEAYYLSGYFEWPVMKREMKDRPTGAYFTHREEQPPGNAKAALFDSVAGLVDLRIATAEQYAAGLRGYGPTALVAPPVERHRFTIPPARRGGGIVVAGFSGYTYRNGRKGEGLARALISAPAGQRLEWRASGRGWPVPTKKYSWAEMPAFYQGLDILVVTATVEGVPMPPLEALSCGVSVVIPRGVGLLDSLPDMPGIYRYERGNARSAAAALAAATAERTGVRPEALRAATEPFSVYGWAREHRTAFERL